MKRVVIITNIPAPYRVDLFNYLQQNNKNYEFIVIYSSQSEDNRQWTIEEKNFESIFLKSLTIKIKKSNDNKYIHIPYNIFTVLNTIKPDVIIASEYNPTVLQALLWSKINNRKFISWSDGTLNSEKNINILQKISRKLVIGNADSFIASSTKTKEAQIFYGADRKKIFVSLLTINVEKNIYTREKFENYNLLFVGSLIKRKGIDLLINALANVKYKYRLTIVGEGTEKSDLIRQAKKLNIIDNIKFVGFKEGHDLMNYYEESDIFILPTREDCFGLVTLEAMCHGLAIINSVNADGSVDLICDGENGLIVNPESVDSFRTLIEYLLSDVKNVEKLGRKTLESIEKFKFKNVSRGFIDAIDYVV